METGVNSNSKIIIPNGNMEIGKENKMEVVGKELHQHNGKGTATLVDKRWNHVPARKVYNSQKNVTDIIIDDNKKRLVIASHTPGKVREISALLSLCNIEVISAAALGLSEPAEDGASFVENANIKATAAAEASHLPALLFDNFLHKIPLLLHDLDTYFLSDAFL